MPDKGVNLVSCIHVTLTPSSEYPVDRGYRHSSLHLEKRSCQLFYYCVHMARKTTPLCYVSFYVRCSVFHLGYVSLYVRCSVLDLPTRGSRVLCTCTADIVLQCSPCSDVHARGTSFFGTASCMSCFGYFVSWPGLFRFGAAEISFRGIFLNDR